MKKLKKFIQSSVLWEALFWFALGFGIVWIATKMSDGSAAETSRIAKQWKWLIILGAWVLGTLFSKIRSRKEEKTEETLMEDNAATVAETKANAVAEVVTEKAKEQATTTTTPTSPKGINWIKYLGFAFAGCLAIGGIWWFAGSRLNDAEKMLLGTWDYHDERSVDGTFLGGEGSIVYDSFTSYSEDHTYIENMTMKYVFKVEGAYDTYEITQPIYITIYGKWNIKQNTYSEEPASCEVRLMEATSEVESYSAEEYMGAIKMYLDTYIDDLREGCLEAEKYSIISQNMQTFSYKSENGERFVITRH